MKLSELNVGTYFGYGGEVIGYNQVMRLIANEEVELPIHTVKKGEMAKVLDQVYTHHINNIEQDEYPVDIDEEVTIDYSRDQALVRLLITVPTGEQIFFKDGDKYVIRTKDDRYVMASSLPDGSSYTMIDTIEGVCGPNDRLFNPYNMNDDTDIKRALQDLKDGKINISHVRKRGADVLEVIDIEGTLDNI